MVSFRSLVWFCSGDFTYQLTDYNKVNEKQRLIKKLRNMSYIYSIFLFISDWCCFLSDKCLHICSRYNSKWCILLFYFSTSPSHCLSTHLSSTISCFFFALHVYKSQVQFYCVHIWLCYDLYDHDVYGQQFFSSTQCTQHFRYCHFLEISAWG